ncbi:MAG: hypothetical protein ACTS9Y_05345 [Methylophilus sp.]|uniref:hypothetical protein n=1 Tax=Methylophilus sp. TaxID=29541 RepID=UPI003F9F3FDF
MKSLPSIATVCFALLFATTALADDTFSTKEQFKTPAKIPAPVIAQLTKEVGKSALASCSEPKPADIFEAEIVSLNKTTKAYLVKPARTCLCTEGFCPVWLFQMKGSAAKLIWHASATQKVDVLEKKLNGYRKINEASSDAVHGSESTWSWDRNSYTEIYKNAWHMDADKKCRLGEETIQLVDGKMVNHTIKCPQD